MYYNSTPWYARHVAVSYGHMHLVEHGVKHRTHTTDSTKHAQPTNHADLHPTNLQLARLKTWKQQNAQIDHFVVQKSQKDKSTKSNAFFLFFFHHFFTRSHAVIVEFQRQPAIQFEVRVLLLFVGTVLCSTGTHQFC